MWPEGAKSVEAVTKRPLTAGTNFKNSMVALVNNLVSKVRRKYHVIWKDFVSAKADKVVTINHSIKDMTALD